MRLLHGRMLFLAACALIIVPLGFADVITFNTLPGNGTAIPNGYAGLNWNNFYDMSLASAPMGSGQALVAGNVAYNNAGMAATFSSNNPFSLTSASFLGPQAGDIAVEAVGTLYGKVMDMSTFVLSDGASRQVVFNWSGINEVHFIPVSVNAANVPSAAANFPMHFFLDSLTINGPGTNVPSPEPASLLLLGPGLGLVLRRLRRSGIVK